MERFTVERYELKPIGNSADFNPMGGQTSWYIIIDGTMYMFDVPYSNVAWIMGKKSTEVLDGVTKIVIFITSLKESRVGGLKTFIDVLNSLNIPRMVYVPTDIWMACANYIETVGGVVSECQLMRGDYYQDDNIQAFPRKVEHDRVIPSFAYVIYGGDLFINPTGSNWSCYYSPDNCRFLDDSVLESFLTEPREKTIYHDITYNIDDETHCYKDKVKVPKELRSHVYPINIDDNRDIKKLRTQGYNI